MAIIPETHMTQMTQLTQLTQSNVCAKKTNGSLRLKNQPQRVVCFFGAASKRVTMKIKFSILNIRTDRRILNGVRCNQSNKAYRPIYTVLCSMMNQTVTNMLKYRHVLN